MMRPDRSENDVLIVCALRFAGYAYIEDAHFDHQRALEAFWRTGRWPELLEEQMTVFFALQRFLFKWGGEYEPRNGKCWRAFRSLFLQVSECKVPERYQHPGYTAEWKRKYEPELAQWVALVQQIHETITYDDSAKPAV